MKSLSQLVRSIIWRAGYELRPWQPYRSTRTAAMCSPYTERTEFGPSNIETKLSMVKDGLPFEYSAIVNLNHAVAGLIGPARKIVELGSGTGKFALEASEDSRRTVIASEFDTPTYEWCLMHLPRRDNVVFVNGPVTKDMGPFDLAVSIEVVEHVSNFHMFLRDLSCLAPRAIITTPNRARSSADWHAGPPVYEKHVREWTAGEFYWVLRSFWNDVELFALPSTEDRRVVPVDVDTQLSPLIAECRSPLCRD